jgi:hypothetical protein
MKRNEINLKPMTDWMITTAYIEPSSTSLFVGAKESPTFIAIQQVLAKGPRVEDIAVGDWIYVDMSKYIKTIKKKSKIRAGIGGAEMIEEQLVPPFFAAPGDDTVYFKINQHEIEGIVIDPYKMKLKYSTMEAFIEKQEAMQKESNLAKIAHDLDVGDKQPIIEAAGPMTRTETSPNNLG